MTFSVMHMESDSLRVSVSLWFDVDVWFMLVLLLYVGDHSVSGLLCYVVAVVQGCACAAALIC